MSLVLSAEPVVTEEAVHGTAMFAGIVWVSLALYISLISEISDLTTEVWVSFVIGALLLYLGVGGDFPHSQAWLVIRVALYAAIAIAAYMLYRLIRRTTRMLPATVRLSDVFRRIF